MQATVASNLVALFPDDSGFLKDDEGALITDYITVSDVGPRQLQVDGTQATIGIPLPAGLSAPARCKVSAVAQFFRAEDERREEGLPVMVYCVAANTNLRPALCSRCPAFVFFPNDARLIAIHCNGLKFVMTTLEAEHHHAPYLAAGSACLSLCPSYAPQAHHPTQPLDVCSLPAVSRQLQNLCPAEATLPRL